MSEQNEPTPKERGILELLDDGAWIVADTDGPDPKVAIEGGGKNPPQVTMGAVEQLVDREWIYEVWDDEEELSRPRYVISETGMQYLEDNPSPASRTPSTPVDPEAAEPG